MKVKFHVNQIDAWADGEGGWYFNDCYNRGTFETKAKDLGKAFRRYLRKVGCRFIKGKTVLESDGYSLIISEKMSGRPMFEAVPEEPIFPVPHESY